MEMDNKKMIIGIVVALLIVIAVFIVGKQRQAKKKKFVEELQGQIAGGGGTISGNATINVKADDNYDASVDVQKILDSKGFFNDDEEAVFQTLQNLGTKSRLKKLREEFQRKTGKDLEAWLFGAGEIGTSFFLMGDSVLEKDDMPRYNTIINSLK